MSIQVAVRVRPFNTREKEKYYKNVYSEGFILIEGILLNSKSLII